jgi:hypothetical protein
MPVTLHVWRVSRSELGTAWLRMATEPRRLRAMPGVRFAKVFGTGRGVTFGLGDADPTRFGALVVWDFKNGDVSRVDEHWRHKVRLDLTPLHHDGPVLALTRARLRPSRAMGFWRAIPPVAREAGAAPGLLARFGIGEAPIGWQGTVSLWRGAADLVRFAYRQPEHRAVVARTRTDRWYAEELFARFAVRDIVGDTRVIGYRGSDDGTREQASA